MSSREFQKKLKALRQTERGIRPDPAWVSRSREILVMQVRNSMPVRPPTLRERLNEFVRQFVPAKVLAIIRGPAVSVTSVIGIVLGGSIASVSAAERSLPGDLLYPVKLVSEQTRLAFTSDKTDKLKLKAEFTTRRMHEIKEIVTSDVGDKKERINEAADILKRDLDTVKTQLNEMTAQSPVAEVAAAAKLIDQKSTEITTELKNVRESLPGGAKLKVSEAEAAAVNAGVKAVQVLIDSHDNPEARGVMSQDELIQSIQGKVQGLEEHIADATKKLVENGVVTTGTLPGLQATSGTSPFTTAAATSSISQIISAQSSLDQAKQLIQEDRLSEVKDMLTDAAKAMVNVETVVSALSTSGTAANTPIAVTATSTVGVPSTTATSTPASASSTVLTAPSATSTPASASSTTSPITTSSTSTPK